MQGVAVITGQLLIMGKQPDAFVDGQKTEFKTPDPGADSSTIRNDVNKSISRSGQARDIIFDARGTGLSKAESTRGIGPASISPRAAAAARALGTRSYNSMSLCSMSM